MTSKGYTFVPETQIGSSQGKKYTFTSEDNLGKGYQVSIPEEDESRINDFDTNAQEFAQSPGTQVALGLTQAITSPLDLTKMYLMGEGFSGLEEAKEASERLGIPFDEEKEREKIVESFKNFPTLSRGEEIFEEQTGISTKPKDLISKVLRGGSEFIGMAPKGAKLPQLKPKSLNAESQSIRKTGEEFGLSKFAGMEAEKPPSINPIVSPQEQVKLKVGLEASTKKAIDEIIKEKIPVKKMKEMGIDLESAYKTAYSAARETAEKMGDKNIDFSNVTDWIRTEIKKAKGSSPSPSKQQKIYIDILEKELKSLSKSNKTSPTISTTQEIIKPSNPINTLTGELLKPKVKTTTDIISPTGKNINLITGKKIEPTVKQVTASKAINQYQNYNDNVKGIWRKPEFSGSENTVKNAYAGLNEQIIHAIEKANPELGKELGFANRVFHQTSKLDQVDGILSKAFKDGYDANKLSKIVSGKRDRLFLERSLGKGSVQDLERIAKYGQVAEKKIFNELKNPITVKEYLTNITPTQLALLAGFKAHIGAPYYLGKAVINRIQGKLFTRNSTKKDYVNFLKEASQLGKNPFPLFKAAKKLEKSIQDEFGSDEELLSENNQEE